MKNLMNVSGGFVSRKGVVAPLLAVLSVPLIGMLAFSIDYGYLKIVESELQRAADASVLSAVLDLVPDESGYQNLAAAQITLESYVQLNLAKSPAGDHTFIVLDSDIEFGSYDESSINGMAPVVLRNSGVVDTVRVRLRRDTSANGAVDLYFARVLGINRKPVTVTATAVLRRGKALQAEVDVLPFALPEEFWDNLSDGDTLNIYNDNKIEDGFGNQVTVLDADGNRVPGNWGTVDIGPENNSTSDLSEQILYGLKQSDLDALFAAGRIPNNMELRAPVYLQADPGLSAGMKDDVRAIHGQTRIIPIYDAVNGSFEDPEDAPNGNGGGNNAEFYVVKWGVIEVITSYWNGNQNTWIRAQKSWTYSGSLVPQENLTDKSSQFENAFASPVLVR